MNLSNTLKKLLARNIISESALARHTGVAQPIIHRIINTQNTNPKLETLKAIANYFNVTISQLIGEIPIQENSTPNLSEEKLYLIPLITWEMVDTWIRNSEHHTKDVMKIITNFPVNKTTYCLKIEDISAEPIFTPGSLLVIDSRKTPKNKDYVIVQLKNKQITIRQILIDGDSKYLKSLNTELVTAPLQPCKNYMIKGTLIQSITNY